MRSIALSLIAVALVGCNQENKFIPGPTDPVEPIDTGDTSIEEPQGENPVAVCEVNKNPVQPPFETAIFTGENSYDPQDRAIVGYEWALVSTPPGNAVALSTRTGVSTSLTPQLAGIYRVELNVINDLGLRSDEPCVIDLDANPDEDLWVEMFWSHNRDDMDLHLLRPGGSKRSGGDCNWTNCRRYDNLDWGTIGEDGDDPVLDLDDIPGMGPENINISDPEPGDFTVFVHDYPGANIRQAPTNVTVNIYLGGEQVFSETRRISGDDSDEMFARVNPTTGVVTPL